MAFFWIYDPQTGVVHQKLEGVTETSAIATAAVFNGAFRECDSDSPSSGILITEEGWEPIPVPTPAESLEVSTMRGERNSMLNQTMWTQTADSPLTEACKEAYRLWRIQLNRWLVDYPDGLTPLPAEPALEYLPLEEQI